MSKKTDKKENSVDSLVITEEKFYVITRNGLRVSELVYVNKNYAKTEFDLWNGIIKKWPDGTRIELVEYNETRHKVL
jgi:hypothetical protein